MRYLEFFSSTALFPTCLLLQLMCWIRAGLCHCCVPGGCSGHVLPLKSCFLRSEKQTTFSANKKSCCLRSWRTGRCSSLCLRASEVWPGSAKAAIGSLTPWWSSCKDLQLHKEIVNLPYLPGGQLLIHSRNGHHGGIPDLLGTILFVSFPQVNGYSSTSVDSTRGLCCWEQLLCPPVFPPSFSGKGFWKLPGNTTKCLPHKISSHLRRTEFYSSCLWQQREKKDRDLFLNFRKLWFKLSFVIEVEIEFYCFMGKTDLYLSIFWGGCAFHVLHVLV